MPTTLLLLQLPAWWFRGRRVELFWEAVRAVAFVPAERGGPDAGVLELLLHQDHLGSRPLTFTRFVPAGRHCRWTRSTSDYARLVVLAAASRDPMPGRLYGAIARWRPDLARSTAG